MSVSHLPRSPEPSICMERVQWACREPAQLEQAQGSPWRCGDCAALGKARGSCPKIQHLWVQPDRCSDNRSAGSTNTEM